MNTILQRLVLRVGGLICEPLQSGAAIDDEDRYPDENLTAFGRFTFMLIWIFTFVATITAWYWLIYGASAWMRLVH